MAVSPKQSSTITTHCGGRGLSVVSSLGSRPDKTMIHHMGYLRNNQSSDSLAFSEANTLSSSRFLRMASNVSVDSGMASSMFIPYRQFCRSPSGTEAISPSTGQNQSYSPIEGNHAGQLPQLQIEESHADSENLVIWAMQHQILLDYVHYKKAVVNKGDARVSFINQIHSTACKNNKCTCEKIHSLVSHYDGCDKNNCKICGPVWYSIVTNKPHPKYEHVKRSQRDSGDGGYGQSGFVNSETKQPPLKRLKVENSSPSLPENGICNASDALKVQQCNPKLPLLQQLYLRDSGDTGYGQSVFSNSEIMQPPLKDLKVENSSCLSLPENGICHASAALKVQQCYPKLPPLLQLPESPESFISEVIKMNMDMLPKLIEDSTSTKEITNNLADHFPIFAAESLLTHSGDVCSYKSLQTDAVGSQKEGNRDFKDDTGVANNEIDHLNKLESSTLGSLGLADGFKEGETKTRTSSQELIMKNKLIVYESNRGKELACGFKEGETEVKTDSGQELLVLDNEFIDGGCEEREAGARTNSNQTDLAIDNELIEQESNVAKDLAANCDEGEIEGMINSNQKELAVVNELATEEGNHGKEIKLETPIVNGVSLIENFTAQQIKEHISSLRQWTDQNALKKETENRIVGVDSKNLCQLCGAEKLSFAPEPIFCSLCGIRIRRSANYYSTPEENDIRQCFCTSCYKASWGSIKSYDITFSKEKLNKKKNGEEAEAEESWVQCDKCEGWQHQICALFNDKNDIEGKAQFICPRCCLEEIQNGERTPTLKSATLDARDLPRTMLSDHIEQRLFRRLQKEREHKARITGKSIDEIPEAEGLVVRVVSSLDKLVKVKKQLLDVIQNDNYSAEFPYKLQVVFLFQKIEGVDVCLFSMYVQEFGSECGHPNQRSLYISYLDSVKYFRPETKTTTGEALRTVVYHEILIGYLEYCKKRGFATCYFWVCPPLKGDDFILYCHPESQKTPKPDKLRHWYQSMLQKAAEEKVVTGLTNLYDQFFVTTGQYNSKVTVAHLPYFDGDYWSSVAERVIENIEKTSEENSNNAGKKTLSKRTLKAMGHTNPSEEVTKDIMLMQELGQTILPNKENFIIAHLQFVCTHCHTAILSGWRWFCSMCDSFQLCERCHDTQQNVYEGCAHTLRNGEKHAVCKIIVDLPSVTDDRDVPVDNSLFENRHNFLSFCQKNNYQFDTLRRAKHSSMMILHYLHNPTPKTSGTACSTCNKNTPKDQCWICDICPNVAFCAGCYQRYGSRLHRHKLTPHSPAANSRTKNRELETKEFPVTVLLEVLLHACQCRSSCSYPICALIKKLFSHSKYCTVRYAGGCKSCKKIWLLLGQHSRDCEESDCNVPRCRDIKEHKISLAKKSESVERDSAI